MPHKLKFIKIVLFLLLIFCCYQCNNHKTIKEKEIVKAPEKMDDQISDNIKSVLDFATTSNGKINDSVQLSQFKLVNTFYTNSDFKGVWSTAERWKPVADSMYEFIKKSKYYGLYPEDYHFNELQKLRLKIEADSLTRMDAVAWTKADLMLTDAFFNTLKDLKEGRLIDDSVSIISRKNAAESFFIPKFKEAITSDSLTKTLESVEPKSSFYSSLKALLPGFVDNMDTEKYQYIDFPYIDTLQFYKNLHKRLMQSGIGKDADENPDSAVISNEVKKYQAKHKLKADGKPGEGTVRELNSSDYEKFRIIAVTLDRYKALPTLPESYLWVNIPAFYLKLVDNDSIILESKVIVGKPATPTPLLTSAISNMVTFPNWTIPESIIKKDILPALKINPGYLASKGFSLVDYHGQTVDPYSVKWAKYKNGIPWKIVQGSGDDNALGIFKFNFNNPYSVYLHDTNQRYLFGNSNRALSHGCVRVQKWEQIAFYIAKSDSLATKAGHRISYNTDSIKTWIANQDRKTIMVKKRLPLYIEYFTCEAKNDNIVFYNDIYNTYQFLEEKYFADKSF
ncbi:MAG: L,D-transpeptidase family protein [Ginsengibacter sp.]